MNAIDLKNEVLKSLQTEWPAFAAAHPKLAAEIGSSEYKVQQALNVKEDPALAKEVAQGTKTLREANKQVKAKRVKIKAAAPRGKGAKGKASPVASSCDMTDAVNDIVARVDAVLDTASQEDRKAFMKLLKEALKGRK